MSIYVRNRNCSCMRCRTRGLMGGGVLVTLGVLFLLDNYNVVSFDSSWPILLIVIGLFSFAARSASTEGHVQPGWMNGQTSVQDYNDPRQSGPGPGPTGPGPEVK